MYLTFLQRLRSGHTVGAIRSASDVFFFFHLMSNFNVLKVLTLFDGFAVGGCTVKAYLVLDVDIC